MRVLRTNRLTLEPQLPAHADEMFRVLSDPAIYEHENEPPESLEWLRARFTKLETRLSGDGTERWLNWVIRLSTGELIGFVQATVSPNHTASIAYVLAGKFWGQGYASEAVRATIDELMAHHDVQGLSAVLKRENVRSLRLLERLGFTHASPERLQQARIDPDELLMVRPCGRQTVGEHLFVVSGCSGSGKSTLLEALAGHGETVSAEPGRQIVKEQLRLGGDGLPWLNPQRFIDLCAEHAIREFDRHVAQPRRVFFDRSFVDVASAVELTGLVAPDALQQALRSKRYASRVFISPPWEALFGQDEERRHTFSDAVAEYEVLVPTYRRHGYEVVFLPQLSVPERVAFVQSVVSSG